MTAYHALSSNLPLPGAPAEPLRVSPVFLLSGAPTEPPRAPLVITLFGALTEPSEPGATSPSLWNSYGAPSSDPEALAGPMYPGAFVCWEPPGPKRLHLHLPRLD